MADVFEEVEEELRAARYQAWLQKGWPYAAGAAALALLITLGVWGFTDHQKSEQSKAAIGYDQGLQALENGDIQGADGKFAALAASAPAGYRTLALMQQAGIRVVNNKPEEAVRLLDQAAKAAPDLILADNARLKAALLEMDTHSLSDVAGRLTPLTDDKRPYHLAALEALAMARLQAGRPQDAQGDIGTLTLSQDASDAAHTRAQYMKALIQSGSVAALPAAAKATPIMPPPQAQPQIAPSPASAGAAQ